MGTDTRPGRRRWRVALILALCLCGVVAGSMYLADVLTPENTAAFKSAVAGLGVWGPVAYMATMVLASLALVPCSVIAVLGGAFGMTAGVVYASASSTAGACLSFLVARYLFRDRVERWARHRPLFDRLSDGVAKDGWKMVVLTRLTPFPFGLQNYLYGLTRIRFTTFVIFSWLCMLPATIGYILVGSAVVDGKGDVRRTVAYLGGAVACLVLLSFVPRALRARSSRRNH
ncbi:MAG: TVP38/TMEM64 family protein [Lentisphaerae bacterium]|nr:TVP38/TMEM64 family protein [Lentisphaerota bacterium]